MTGTVHALLVAASSSSSSSGGSSSTLIIFLVLIAVVGYFLLIRPQRQRQRRQREQQSGVAVGDEILTVGGIVGRVVAVDADRVTVVSGGDTVGFAAAGSEPTRPVFVRNALSRKVEPTVAPDVSQDEAPDDDMAADEPPSSNGGYPSQLDGHAGTPFDDAAEGAESEGTNT